MISVNQPLNKLIVGIDIGKNFHQAIVIDVGGQILGGSVRFPNTIAGAETLIQRISSVNPDSLPVVFGLEATGHYWLALYSYLAEKGYPVSVVNPYPSQMLLEKFTFLPLKLTKKIPS